MTDKRFNIVFQGELVTGADPARVRENLARVFKMDAAKVEVLFSGKRVVLKKDVDQASAMKFRAVMKQAGAKCEMAPVGEPADSSPSSTRATFSPPDPAQPRVQANQEPPSAREDAADENVDMETIGTIRIGGSGFSGPFDVAPTGTDLEDISGREIPPPPDISHLSMAPPGTDLEELPRIQKVDIPDISHLAIAEDKAS